MKNYFYKFILFVFFIRFTLSCRQNKPVSPLYFEGNALGTTYHITVIPVKKSQKINRKDIDSVITAVNNSLSTYQANSLISKINRGKTLKPDKQFTDVFYTAQKIYRETGGLYDPTIGILVNAWGFGPGKKIDGIEKDSTIVDSLKKFVGYDYLQIDEYGFLKKKYPQIYIDFNSIAKGYAIDRVGKMLQQKAYDNFLVEIGGEVLAKGKNTLKNRDWLVAIDNPDRKNGRKFISKIALNNQAMATSGNYRKYYIDKKTGKKYVHTIDPITGYPAIRHLLSASVIAPKCTLADGYATACMVMGFEASKTFLNKHPELQAFLVYSDEKGNIRTYKTPKIEVVQDID
jgi:thiamine biosynthesis lipoprotein